MKKRARVYFKESRLKKRLGITSWHLDWVKMQLPDKPGPNMAFIMPGVGLTHADGSPVIVKPEYYAPLKIKYVDP